MNTPVPTMRAIANICLIAGLRLDEAVACLEKELIEVAIKNAGLHGISGAALTLGVHRNTIMRKMRLLQIAGVRKI